jgi:hypothetical protein
LLQSDYVFRRLKEGSNITITPSDNQLLIDAASGTTDVGAYLATQSTTITNLPDANSDQWDEQDQGWLINAIQVGKSYQTSNKIPNLQHFILVNLYSIPRRWGTSWVRHVLWFGTYTTLQIRVLLNDTNGDIKNVQFFTKEYTHLGTYYYGGPPMVQGSWLVPPWKLESNKTLQIEFVDQVIKLIADWVAV